MRAQLMDLLVGAKDYALGKAEVISGLSLKETQITFELTRPHRHLDLWLSQPGLLPRPRQQPDGSWSSIGAFTIQSISGAEITLIPNPAFQGGKPLLDKLVFVCEPDYNKQVELFKAGKLQASNIPMDPASTAASDPALHDALVRHVTAQQLLGQFDQHQFPWGDQQFQSKKGLRQSVNWGLDRETLSVILHEQLEPWPHFFPQPMKQYVDPVLVTSPLYGLAVETERARQAQKEADHEQGNKLIQGMDLAQLSGSDLNELDREVLKYWDEISIKMRPFPVTTEELRKRIDAGTHEILLSRCCPAYADPDALAYALLHSSLYGLGGNYSCLKDPELDSMIAEAQAAGEDVLRRKLYQQLSRKLEEDATFVFIGTFTPTLLISPSLSGLQLNPYDFDASLPNQDFAVLGLSAAPQP
jgi:ABC-type oligopeptide transport system substrate-binding subunit